MRHILIVLVFFISGCVAYPSKHVSEPRYEVTITGSDVTRVRFSSSLDNTEDNCDIGKNLKLNENGLFVLPEEYGYLKVAFMVPVHLFKPIRICAFSEGNDFFWTENIGVLPNSYPEVFRFNCTVKEGKMACENSVHNKPIKQD